MCKTKKSKKVVALKNFIFLLLCMFLPYQSFGKEKYEVIKLWDSPKTVNEMRSELRVFFPSAEKKRSQTCILICPGGSYHHLGLVNEGSEVASYFNEWGMVTVVLRYRVSMWGNHHPAMVEDFQRAMMILREKMGEWDVKIIGAIGFSAGGHLVTLGGATDKDYLLEKGFDASGSSLRPEFVCPIYPVVSSEESISHKKSFRNFLSLKASEEEKNNFSMEKHIPLDMPPSFVLACKDDDVVDYRNSIKLHEALEKKNVKCKFYLFEKGGHGFGTNRTISEETSNWGELLVQWLVENEFL